MADVAVNFSISGNFPNHVVNPSRLQKEIQASSIVTALDFISTSGDVCAINFKAALSAGDTTTLNAIVAAHQGAPLSSGASAVTIDTNNQQIIAGSPVTASGNSSALGNYGSKSVALIINVKNAPTGTSPTLQFTLAEVDPGDGVTVVGSSTSSTVITGIGVQTLTLPSTVSGSFLVSWTVTGAGASFTGVFATLVSKNTVGNADKFGNPIVQLAPQAVAFGLASGAAVGQAAGYVNTTVAGRQPVRATGYQQQSAAGQRSVSSANANDTGAGTGAQKVTINYLTSAFVLKSETVTLNGVTPVNTVNTDIQYIESIQVTQVGSGGRNAGVISLFQNTGGGGSAFATIAAGDNQTYWAHHYVPAGVTCYLLSVQGGASAQSGTLELVHIGNPAVATPAQVGGVGLLSHGGGQDSRDHVFEVPFPVPGPDLVLLTDNPNGTTASKTSGGFEYIQF